MFAVVVQGADYRHAITKDVRIQGRRGKKNRNGVAATPNHPPCSLIPCSDLRETCFVVPNLRKGQDTLLIDPSQYEEFRLVSDHTKWQTIQLLTV